ncbi:MAG: peptidase M22, partial [Oscillospiraceae bacterium]
MPYYIGVDTSNYTTSLAVYDAKNKTIIQSKKLLPVKENELGLRQSDAVFFHTKQISDLFFDLFKSGNIPVGEIKAVSASTRPRTKKGSYMPCFLVGDMVANALSAVLGVPKYEFSHQDGHIVAALYSAKKLDLLGSDFVAFHFSGGTTECVYVKNHKDNIIETEIISQSLDLKAGQAIDRVGNMLGLRFPAGKELDRLSLASEKTYKINPTFKGENPCISGLENKCKKMIDENSLPQDTAKYALEYIVAVAEKMLKNAREKYGEIPVILSGGVMSNSLMQEKMTKYHDV